ncbi:MAG: membrane protein insertion efficiency factor YidD [Acidobacteriota bacterium]
MSVLIRSLIRLYQKAISPILPRACRFHPSCSEYMRRAIEKWGVRKGIFLGIRRIVKCHPWNPGGMDPVP